MAKTLRAERAPVGRIRLTPLVALSRLAWGMMRVKQTPDPAELMAKLTCAAELGITTIDLADIYGDYEAEAILGRALALSPALRSRLELVSKCGIAAPSGPFADRPVKYYDSSKAYIEAAVERSLAALGVGYLDLLLIHRPDPLCDPVETGAALDGLVRTGKVRAVGVSNFQPWDLSLLQSRTAQPLCTNQIELSLSALAPLTNGQLAGHQQRREPVMAWSPLGGGALLTAGGALGAKLDELAGVHQTDRAGVALAFLLSHPHPIIPVLGTQRLERLEAAAAACAIQLSRVEWFELYEAALGRPVP